MKENTSTVLGESLKGLLDADVIDEITMHEFEALHLKPVHEFTPREIKRLRKKEKVSQHVFAKILNLSPSTVKKWETGEKKPSGPSLKLLDVVAKHGIVSVL